MVSVNFRKGSRWTVERDGAEVETDCSEGGLDSNPEMAASSPGCYSSQSYQRRQRYEGQGCEGWSLFGGPTDLWHHWSRREWEDH